MVKQKQIQNKLQELKKQWNNNPPYRYIVIDNFINETTAQLLSEGFDATISEYARPQRSYLYHKNKISVNEFQPNSAYAQFFDALNHYQVVDLISEITGIGQLIPDLMFEGGGLQQTQTGGFENLHVNQNMHPVLNLYRRINLVLFLNKNWENHYNGHLEFWDLKRKKQLTKIAPIFNRCVIFENNNTLFHGYPQPIKSPKSIHRNSLSKSYYTKEAPATLTYPKRVPRYFTDKSFAEMTKLFKSGVRVISHRLSSTLLVS